ncbi:glycosyltransferase [Chitinimonas sp. BJYL2]|uniref:glycosyltransferase n=1 Tax=Chitinimonas sp. BJYL2 TaxID=2976696 RepID=UPI0022B50244|nr:glycosyltransferase [Chitinimonas sp. BJYL2]
MYASIRCTRIFLGKLPYLDYLRVLQTSSAHVYLTYPFVMSWSLPEAMAAGCPLIASDTSPVREVIRHGEHGWRVDFFDTDTLVKQRHTVLDTPDAQLPLRRQAREHVQTHYSQTQGRQAWLTLLND